MTTFSHEGNGRDDHILLNDCRDWALVPKGTIRDIDFDLPVRVLVGNSGFGYKHILGYKDRKVWMEENAGSIEDFIHLKLGQSGDIFGTDGRLSQPRFKIAMRSSPSSLLIFEIRNLDGDDPYLSFVTAYHFNRPMREYKLGRYVWRFRVGE